MSRPLIQPEPINSALKRLKQKISRTSNTEEIMVYFHANRLSTVFASSGKFHKLLASGTKSIIGVYDENALLEDVIDDVHSYYAEFDKQIAVVVNPELEIPVFRSSGRKVKKIKNNLGE